MDRDFQDRYQRAEQAYGEERYSDAHALAMGLLDELNDTPLDADNEAAWYGWRSFVALLLGHISLYGLEQPTEASAFYQLVLDSQPPDTQGQLAQQGLERAVAAAEAAEAPIDASPEPEPVIQARAPEPEATPRPPTGELPDLLKDPFLASEAPAANPSPSPSRSTAMPWLDEGATAPKPAMDLAPPAFVTAEPGPEPEPEPEPEPKAKPEPEPEPELVAAPEPDVEPEADVETDSDPVPDPVPDPEPVAFVESELVEEPVPAASPSRPTTRDEAMKALQPYWIRVDVSDLAGQPLSNDDIPSKENAASALNNPLSSIPIEPGQLNLSLAVSIGWRAFRASPWPFVAFTLICFAISVIFGLIGVLATGMADLTGTLLGGSSSLCGTLINLWWLTGMTRGAWAAVHGDKPTLQELMRMDLSSCWRLFAGTLLVNVILALCIVVGGVGSAVVSAIMPLLTIVIFLLIGIGALVFSVNQSFLPFFTTVMEMGPMVAVKEGQVRVQPLWWRVFGLLLVEAVILAIGLLMLGVGLVAATPLMFCVSAAALQQIVGPMAKAEADLLP